VEALDIVPFGLSDDVEFQIGQEAVIEFGELKIDLHAFLDGRIGKMIGDSHPMARNGQLLFKVGEIILAFGVIDMGQQFGSFVDQVVASAEKIPGGAHAFWIDIGSRQGSAPKQNGDLFGVDFVIFALAAVDGFHVECMSKDKRNGFPVTQIGEPVPDEHAFNGNDDVFPVRLDGPEERFRGGFEVFVENGIALLIQDTDVHGSSV